MGVFKLGVEKKKLEYDFSLFEIVPKKEERDNLINLPKRKAKHKIHPLSIMFTGFLVTTCVSVILLMIHSQVSLMELTEQINRESKFLEESKSVYTQLEMKVDSQLSLMAVENYAKNVLDMQRTAPCQVEYVSLSDGDKSEFDFSHSKFNLLDKLKDIFSNI